MGAEFPVEFGSDGKLERQTEQQELPGTVRADSETKKSLSEYKAEEHGGALEVELDDQNRQLSIQNEQRPDETALATTSEVLEKRGGPRLSVSLLSSDDSGTRSEMRCSRHWW